MVGSRSAVPEICLDTPRPRTPGPLDYRDDDEIAHVAASLLQDAISVLDAEPTKEPLRQHRS